MRVEESVTIEVPREKVWEWVADPSRADKFMQGVRFWVIEGEPTTGLRARYETRMKVGTAEVGGVVEVIEFDAPHEVAWTSITGIDQRGRWILRDQGGRRTKVTFRLSYQVPGGLMGLVADRIGSPLVRRNVRRSLGALKRMLEVR
jgi:uncharacterized membrane protein